MDDLQRDIDEWSQRTFPNSTVQSIMVHLEEEVQELGEAIATGDALGIKQEAGDVLHLLFSVAQRSGFSLQEAVRWVFARNQYRDWGPSSKGYWKHQNAPTAAPGVLGPAAPPGPGGGVVSERIDIDDEIEAERVRVDPLWINPSPEDMIDAIDSEVMAFGDERSPRESFLTIAAIAQNGLAAIDRQAEGEQS